jgi:hypothetical protein
MPLTRLTMQTLAAKIEEINARLKAVEALEEQLASAIRVFDAAALADARALLDEVDA